MKWVFLVFGIAALIASGATHISAPVDSISHLAGHIGWLEGAVFLGVAAILHRLESQS